MRTPAVWKEEVPRLPDPAGQLAQASAWAVGVDTLARASSVAVTAADEPGLRGDMAHAITGLFADWVLVDLRWAGQAHRAVAARYPRPHLAGQLRGIRLETCPLIRSAVDRCTPVVCAPIEDELLLGALPDGEAVAYVLDARSAASGPIVAAAGVRGAITIVRASGRPPLGFRELGILAQIAELTGAATDRLCGHSPPARPASADR
jgi:GAF domain-containing protein